MAYAYLSLRKVPDDHRQALIREIARELDLKTVRRAFKSRAGGLIVDNEEITIGAVDIAKANVDGGNSTSGVHLHQSRSQQLV